jgi:hypothetical protein
MLLVWEQLAEGIMVNLRKEDGYVNNYNRYLTGIVNSNTDIQYLIFKNSTISELILSMPLLRQPF